MPVERRGRKFFVRCFSAHVVPSVCHVVLVEGCCVLPVYFPQSEIIYWWLKNKTKKTQQLRMELNFKPINSKEKWVLFSSGWVKFSERWVIFCGLHWPLPQSSQNNFTKFPDRIASWSLTSIPPWQHVLWLASTCVYGGSSHRCWGGFFFCILGAGGGMQKYICLCAAHQRHSGLFLTIATGRIRSPKEAGS